MIFAAPLDLDPALRPVFLAWSILVGAVVGSFLNVVIARVPAGLSVVRPRSRCPRCGAGIAWYDNVPILSWLWLRARCRSCGVRIPVRYPLVEALGAAAGGLAFARHGLSAAALAELLFVAALVALAFIDLDTWLLPHAITWPLIAAGMLASALGATGVGWRSSAAGAAIGFAVFAAIAVVGEKVLRREAMGWGDVWLLSGLGAWLGVGALLPVVLLASVQGSLVGLALIALGRAQRGPPEPVAPGGTLEPGHRGDEPGAPPAPGGEAPVPAPPPAAEATEATTPPATPEHDEDEDWIPPKNAVPFGPFLALGALEWLYLSAWIASTVPALRLFR